MSPIRIAGRHVENVMNGLVFEVDVVLKNDERRLAEVAPLRLLAIGSDEYHEGRWHGDSEAHQDNRVALLKEIRIPLRGSGLTQPKPARAHYISAPAEAVIIGGRFGLPSARGQKDKKNG